MSRLLTIQDFAQQVVDATAAVIDFDVIIIDDNISLVAGSGKYKKRIGFNYGKGSITQKLLSDNAFYNRQTVFVLTPHYNNICKDCETRADCDVSGALLCPVYYESKVIGTISLYATNEQQKETLLCKREKLGGFLEKISTMISSKLGEQEMHARATHMDEKLFAVIDLVTVNKGIVAFNEEGQITQCNKVAVKMLSKNLDELYGCRISEIFLNLPPDVTSLEKGLNIHDLHSGKNEKGQKIVLSGTVFPYEQSSGQRGGIISFLDRNKIRDYSAKLVEHQRGFTFEEIHGSCKSIRDLKERMARVAVTDSTILLHGESGTGKELFAQAIHFESPRSDGPFIAINCGAIPEALLESELFGYEDGAFTGAKRGGKPGKFELAQGGTIFLDEIGDMPLHLQVKLLRVLQEKKFERIGGIESIWTDVRLIAATNRDLEEMIKKGDFRNDLFYRISVIPFSIPPLREREEDILFLSGHFLDKFNNILRKHIRGFEPEAEKVLEKYTWPGNVRELENAIEYAVNIETEPVITVKSLPPRILDAVLKLNSDSTQINSLEEMERVTIIKALRQYGLNTVGKEKVARELGISLATLYRKIKELGINKACI